MKMNKNVNHFSSSAFNISKTRTKFSGSPTWSADFQTGKLIPVKMLEVLPGDTWQIDLSSVLRGATPKFPVMDNAYVEYYAFLLQIG